MSVYTPEEADEALFNFVNTDGRELKDRGQIRVARSFLRAVIDWMQDTDRSLMLAALTIGRLCMLREDWVEWLCLSRLCTFVRTRSEMIQTAFAATKLSGLDYTTDVLAKLAQEFQPRR